MGGMKIEEELRVVTLSEVVMIIRSTKGKG